MFEFLYDEPAMESGLIDSVKNRLGIKNKPEVAASVAETKSELTEDEVRRIEKSLNIARNRYTNKFESFKNRHVEWFKENPNVFTLSTEAPYYSSYDKYVSISIINRNAWELTGPDGKNDARRLLTSNYSDVEMSRRAEVMANEFFTIQRELINDVKSVVTPILDGLDIYYIDDWGDWDEGSVDIAVKGISETISTESTLSNELHSMMMEATSEDRDKYDREESIQIACEGIHEMFSNFGMEREIAMPVSRQVKELFTLYPGIIWRIYRDAFKRSTWMYLDFYRDLLTLSHVRGFTKRVLDIDSSNEISNSKKDRLERYLQGDGWWSFMEQSMAMSSAKALAKHQTWLKNTPTKPAIEITLISSDTMIGATYMSIDTSGMNPQLTKEAEEILADMSQRMAGVVQRKGIEYNVDFQWGVVKNKLNPKKLEAVVYAPIKLID